MSHAKDLIEEITTTEKELAQGTGVSSQFVYLVKRGERKGIGWSKKLAAWARCKADKLNELAAAVEAEAA